MYVIQCMYMYVVCIGKLIGKCKRNQGIQGFLAPTIAHREGNGILCETFSEVKRPVPLGHALAAGGLMERNRRTADDGLKSVAMPVAIETVFCQLCRFQSRRKVLHNLHRLFSTMENLGHKEDHF